MVTKIIVPMGWKQVLLDSIATRGSGHTPDKKIPEYWNGNIKWISLADSWRLDNFYIDETNSKTTQEGIRNSSAVLHPVGTVVMSRDAGVGKSAIMKDDMACSQHFMAWRCGVSLDKFFLYYWLQTKKRQFENAASGNTIKTIGLSYFKKLKIILPDRHEQGKIVNILKACDDYIEKLNQVVKLKQKIRKGLMEKLLTGKIRLPGFSEQWQKVKLGEVCNIKKGQSFTKKELFEGNVPVIAGGQEPAYFHNQSNRSGLTITVSASGAYAGFLDFYNIPIFASDCTTIQEKTANITFIFFLLKNKQDYIYHSMQTGGAQPHVYPKDLGKYKIDIPKFSREQIAIANVLTTADQEIKALEKKKSLIEQQKKFLLNKLITGRIRLPEFIN